MVDVETLILAAQCDKERELQRPKDSPQNVKSNFGPKRAHGHPLPLK